MRYSWPKTLKVLKLALSAEFAKLEVATPERLDGFNNLLFQSDAFHPMNSDGDLQQIMDCVVANPNLGKIEAYWDHKHDMIRLGEVVYDVLTETAERVTEYLTNRMNFAPGYIAPQLEVDDWPDFSRISDVIAMRIYNAGRRYPQKGPHHDD